MERVVNIIGLGASAKDTSDTGENWVLNVAYKRIPHLKVDKMFFMDDFSIIMEDDKMVIQDPNMTFTELLEKNPNIEFISRFSLPIQDKDGKTVAQIKGYPLGNASMLAPGSFFTSTIAYAIVYAIMEKVDRIRLYGFEIWSGSDANEYNYQRPCIDFWLAFALGKGIKVEIPYYLMLTGANNQNFYGYKSGELFQNTEKRR